MTQPRDARRYVVVGAGGSIGGLIARLLRLDGQQVACIDLRFPRQGGTESQSDETRWIEADMLAPNALAREALSHADIVVIATSFELLTEALPGLLALVGPACALIETLSIKSPFVALIEARSAILGNREVAGINPMFSGDLDPTGRPTATVIHRNGADGGLHIRAFFDVLRRTGLVIVPTNADMHDRTMAVLQTIGHSAVLAFGDVLAESKLDMDALLALAPPPFRTLFALLARMTGNHPDVYWEIQTKNPFSAQARRALIDALTRLDDACNADDAATFRDGLARIDTTLVQSRPETVALSKRIFDIVGKPV